MPKIIPYRLSFSSGLHIGTRGVNLEEAGLSLPADTIFSALLDAWQRSGGAIEHLVKWFTGARQDIPWLSTSAFPFAGNLLFFPLPHDLSCLFPAAVLKERGKKLKRLRYFSQALLTKALRGESLEAYLFPDDEMAEPGTGACLQNGSLWLLRDEIDLLPSRMRLGPGRRHALRLQTVWRDQRVPRVTVGRISSASNLFHAGRVVFAQDCGLWFGVQWRKPDQPVDTNDTARTAFDKAFQILQEDGLGGERSSGYGAFTARQDGEIQLGADPQPGKLAYLLNRYHPAEDELPGVLDAERGVSYRLESVSGWLRTPSGKAQRRKKAFFIAEGSLVNQPAQQPAGMMIDVQPTYQAGLSGVDHPVWRNGFALALAWPERS